MAKSPAVQWYWSDFLVDTMGWSCTEIGAYMRLLGYEWVNGCIPEDTKRQAIICRIDQGNYRKSIYPNVIGKFEFSNGGGYNQRLEMERSKQQQYSEKQSEKGKKRAEKMWEGHIATAIATAQPKAQPKDSSSSSSSSSIKIKNKRYIHIPPSLDEVKNYCKERNNTIDPEVWFDYYTANGFMVGKNKMKDWKATVRNWERKQHIQPQTGHAKEKWERILDGDEK